VNYFDFNVLFTDLVAGISITQLEDEFGVSESTLRRWKKKGYKRIREEKFWYCESCEVYSDFKHVHHPSHENISKIEKKQNIIAKYNKRLKKCFKTIDKGI